MMLTITDVASWVESASLTAKYVWNGIRAIIKKQNTSNIPLTPVGDCGVFCTGAGSGEVVM